MSHQGAYILLSNASSADDEVAVVWPGGPCYLVLEATWGGGTVKLQYLTPNSTWIDVPLLTATANAIISTTIPAGQVRLNVATSTAVYGYLICNPSVT